MDIDFVRAHLTGPVVSVKTPFNKDGSVDKEGLRRFIDVSIEGGSKSIILTPGDSHYFCLSEKEIVEVTRITCEHVAGRAMVVAADYMFATPRAIEFTEFLRSVGADMYMCLPPTWGRPTPESLSDHYATVARIMPVVVVTSIFYELGEHFGLETLRLLLQKSEGVIAVKEDLGASFVQQMCLICHDRCAVFAGGSKRLHLGMVPFGCDGYMSLFATFKPELSARYWKAIESMDWVSARKIIADYEFLADEHLTGLRGGWNAGLHAMFELYGIAKRWRRKPYTSLDDQEMEKLADFLRRKHLL